MAGSTMTSVSAKSANSLQAGFVLSNQAYRSHLHWPPRGGNMNPTKMPIARSRSRRLSSIIQVLESRRLLSGAELVDGGVLKITGSDTDDSIHVAAADANLVVTINGGADQSFAAADVNQIYVT